MAKEELKEPLSLTDRLKQNAMKSAVKSFLPMILPQLDKVDDFMKSYLDKIELMEWETKAAIMCVMAADGTSHILTCTFADDVLKRVVNKVSTVEFIKTLINQI